MREIEIEFKNLLTLEEFTALQEAYASKLSLPIEQTNWYFDSQSHLRDAKCALRIRLVEGEDLGQVTLKVPQSKVEIFEYTELLPREKLLQQIEVGQISLPLSLQVALQSIDIFDTELDLIAKLNTNRQEYKTENYTLVLDQSSYAGVRDYEIEMEVNDVTEGEKIFKQLLSDFNIPKRKTVNKIVRAIQAFESK